MFRHNILLTFRSFKKFKSNFFINLIGLSTGLASVLLIYLWVNDELMMDNFHEKNDQIYQVMEHQSYAEGIMTTRSTPGLLAETLKEEFPEVEYAATTTWPGDYTLSVEENDIVGKGYYVGQDYLNIFSYGLIQGNPDDVLADKYNIVLSEELAMQIFKTTENVIGRQVVLQHDEAYQVSGIFKGTPAQSTYQFDFLLSFEKFKDNNDWVLSWGNNGPNTFILLKENSNAAEFSDKIAGFIRGREEDSNVTLFIRPFGDMYLYGRYEDGKLSGGRIEYVQLFSIIALFILSIACINFMNLSTARASKRAKEVGIKKAVGANQGSLIFQFLIESVFISFLSLVLAFLLVWLFIPEFNIITGKQISFEFGATILYYSFGVTLITGLLAGSYPAFYLSSYKPLAVLKGEISRSMGELWARRGLVVFQFFLSVILIISVMVINRQISFVNNKNLGYNQENVIYFPGVGKLTENFNPFLAEIKKIPGVIQASNMSSTLMSQNNNTSGLEWEGKDPEQRTLFENVRVNYDLLETLEIKLKEGRFFSREYGTDSSKVIFNQAAIDVMGLTDPIGKTIKLWGMYDLEIIGVTENFHFQSLHTEVNPLFFMIAEKYADNVFIRIQNENISATIEEIKAKHAEFNPGFVLDYKFMDDSYSHLYDAERRVSSLSLYFALVAILISCLGLFGLASFTAERRIKEIGIRKALGASISQIVVLLSKDFTILVGLSIVLAIPTSSFLLNRWLERFAYKVPLEWWLFAGAGFIAILIAFFTVGFQAIKAARINPSECLQDE